MSAGHVAFLISNGYVPDVRVQKEAHTLAAAGYRATIIAWDRARQWPAHELESAPDALREALTPWAQRGGTPPQPAVIYRVRVPAGYRAGRRLLSRIPWFWRAAYGELRRARPDIIHAHDLDTLPVAWWYGARAGVPVIYDAREFYPGMVRANVGRPVSAALDALERALAPRADAVLTVGTRLEARLSALGAKVSIIPNTQILPDQGWIEATRQRVRGELGVPDGALLIGWIGHLTPDRLLAPALKAVAALSETWMLVGGTGPGEREVRRAAEVCSRILPLGQVALDRVAAFVAASDVVYYGLNESEPNSFYFMPNLAFFALAAGRPLLVTPVGEIAAFVRDEGCGLVLASATAAAAIEALERLRDEGLRAALAQRARHLGETRYNWTHTASDLLDVYERLLNVRNCI